MADDIDSSNDLAEILLNAKISNRVVYQGESLEDCEECDTPIPKARQLAIPGCTLCTFCKGKQERSAGGR